MLTPSPNIARIGDDVAEIYPDPHGDTALGRQPVVVLRDRVAQRSGTPGSLDHAVEFDQHPVSGPFEDVSIKLTDDGLDDLRQQSR
jgi:hypothetical protein